ncbi:MAG: zinc-binding dehydrogenase [Candidatus Methylacidiphilales bacterium]
MATTARLAQLERTGSPVDVLELKTEEMLSPGPGEVLVAMEAAPINPADLNYISGTYGVRPKLPATPGLEGCGRVIEAGPGVRLPIGTRVRLPEGTGTWRTHALVEADGCLVLPDKLPPDQAAMIYVNPLTAWRMLHDFVPLQRGDWIVQNAANSGVGRCVIQLAKTLGLRTCNLVRRPELIPDLLMLGADRVELDGPELPRQWPDTWGEAPPRLALNAVGGDSALRLAGLLGPGGTLVTYGAMSRQALKIPNGFLIFNDLRVRGFWLTAWARSAGRETVAGALKQIEPLALSGNLQMPVAATYPLEDLKQAVAHAEQEARGGKVLLRLNS